MNRFEGLVTFTLLVAIFVAAAGCSQRNLDNMMAPDTLDGYIEPIDSTDDFAPDGTLLAPVDEGLTFDLIGADTWIEPEVLPESVHYFGYDYDDLAEGTIVTWETDGGFFIDENGERTQVLSGKAGTLIAWEAPGGSGPNDVEVKASGPRDYETETISIEVDPEADQVRTFQPYHTSLFLDTRAGGRIEVAAGELLVSFRNPQDINVRAAVMAAEGLSPLAMVDNDASTYRVRIPAGVDIDEFREQLNLNPDIEYAEFNHIYNLTMLPPNDPNWGSKWDLVRMNALTAWDTETGSASVTVAVIDTGVDLDHPDLVNHMINGTDFVSGGDGNGGEMAGDGLDNNSNGRTDENVGHGTHCAGIIGALGYNGIGTIGVSLDVTILPLRVFPVNGDGGASTSAIASAINYAVDNGAKVVSLSLGSPSYSSTMDIAITNAVNAGVTVVCAAGNASSESIYYPAGYDESIAVAAINSSDTLSYFSNYGSWVDICAPGQSIYSTDFNNTYSFKSGTSMACPEVAGVAAMLWAYRPMFTVAEIRDALESGADASVYDSNPSYTGKMGTGCVDMLGSLEACAPPGNQIGNNPGGPQDAIDESASGGIYQGA